jgi:phage terminase Nu1 subunit (DNA packaging protein)
MLANRAQISDIFGVAKTTVDTWRSRGCPIIEANGKGHPSKYDTVAVHKWLLGGNVDEDFSALLDEERYRKMKRENDLAEEEVAPISLIREVVIQGITKILPVLESVPLEMKRRNPRLTGSDIQVAKESIAKCCGIMADIKVEVNE